MSTILKTLNKYLNRYLSTKVVFLLDMIVSLAASALTLFLVNIITVRSLLDVRPFLIWMVSSFCFSFIFIWCLRTYRIVIRHMTFRELGRFVMVAFCKMMMVGFVFGMLNRFSSVLYVMMLADFFLTCAAFFVLRVSMILVYDFVKNRLEYRKNCMNVLIYGIGDKSVSLISRLQNSPHYRIVGFIQYGNAAVDHVISETHVYYASSEKQFMKAVDETDAEAILFASENGARKERDRLVKYAIDNRIKLLFAPSIDEMVDGKVGSKLRNIEIEDLLMRPEINISMDEIVANFRDKIVMVTGAAGSIGSELCRQLAGFGVRKLVLFDNAETPMHNLRLELEEKHVNLDFIPIIGDIRLKNRLDYAFREFRPQVVFHAAAYKHVPLMEDNPCEAVLVNVAGSRNVADKCLEYDVEKMVTSVG